MHVLRGGIAAPGSQWPLNCLIKCTFVLHTTCTYSALRLAVTSCIQHVTKPLLPNILIILEDSAMAVGCHGVPGATKLELPMH